MNLKNLLEIKTLFKIIRIALCGDEATPLPENVDWEVIYKISVKHRLHSTLYFGLSKYPEEITSRIPYFEKYKFFYKKIVVQDANRSYLQEKIEADLSNTDGDYCILKGSVTKHLYPDTAMRVMTDIDILYRNISDSQLIEIFKNNGFAINKKEPKEISFIHPAGHNIIEMQTQLVDQGYEKWFTYLEDIWNRLELVSGNKYQMTKEDFYIYDLIHMAKHFVNGGIGINHILDLLILSDNYTDMDRNYVDKHLAITGLVDFEKTMLNLSRTWFQNDLNDEWSEDINILTGFVLSTGAYGIISQKEANQIVKRGDSKMSLRKKVFPDLTMMMNYYGDVLNRHKWLLPFYWIRLNVTRLARGRKSVANGLASVNLVDEYRISVTKNVLDQLGLKDW